MRAVEAIAFAKHEHNHQIYAKLAVLMGLGEQRQGKGSELEDSNGRKYLALFDQYGNQAFGYSHPAFVAALRKKLDTGNINSAKIFLEEDMVKLSEELAAATRGVLPYAYFANGGGETVDNAFKLARGFNRRPHIVSAIGCMHGKTLATLAASGRPEHEDMFKPFMPGFKLVPFNDLAAMRMAVDENTSAVILEPVQAEAGVYVPDAGYLEGVRKLCDERGALLIFDEMQTAFGRLGTTFAFQRFGVHPDMICIGKAFGGGLLPISAVLGTKEVWSAVHQLPSSFGSSLGGNPLCCAVARTVLQLAQDKSFLTGVQEKGEVIDNHLKDIERKFSRLIKRVTGIGMMYGVEFHNDATAGMVLGLIFDLGVTSTFSLYNSRVLRIQPPMVMNTEELVKGLGLFEEALSRARRYLTDTLKDAPGLASVRVNFSLPWNIDDARSALATDAHMLDPFSHPESTRENFQGWVGADPMSWRDEVFCADGEVILDATPGWLWRKLRRQVNLHAAGSDQTRVEILVDWDCNLAGYEGFVNGKIGYFVHSWADAMVLTKGGHNQWHGYSAPH